MPIRIINYGLDKRADGDVVLRGVIDASALGVHPESPAVLMKMLQITPDLHGGFQVDDYQREILPGAKRNELIAAFANNVRIQDVELGMRGSRIQYRDSACLLLDPVYIVDGLQRISAARSAMNQYPELQPHLGAVIYFDSTSEWERSRFRTLNMDRVKLSLNIHLRNLRATLKSTAMLYDLSTNDSTFAMHGRVQWGQTARVGQVLSALGLYRVVSMLHWRFGSIKSGNPTDLANSSERLMETVGVRRMKRNLTVFFQVVDECWGLRQLVYTQSAPHTKQNFLSTLAELFTRHSEFWKDNGDLFVDSQTKRKLAKFPLSDSGVRDLIASSGSGNQRVLYQLVLEHVNKGRRSNRLTENVMPDEGETECETETSVAPEDA